MNLEREIVLFGNCYVFLKRVLLKLNTLAIVSPKKIESSFTNRTDSCLTSELIDSFNIFV